MKKAVQIYMYKYISKKPYEGLSLQFQLSTVATGCFKETNPGTRQPISLELRQYHAVSLGRVF